MICSFQFLRIFSFIIVDTFSFDVFLCWSLKFVFSSISFPFRVHYFLVPWLDTFIVFFQRFHSFIALSEAINKLFEIKIEDEQAVDTLQEYFKIKFAFASSLLFQQHHWSRQMWIKWNWVWLHKNFQVDPSLRNFFSLIYSKNSATNCFKCTSWRTNFQAIFTTVIKNLETR